MFEKAKSQLSYNSIILREELVPAYTHPKDVPVPQQDTGFHWRGCNLERSFCKRCSATLILKYLRTPTPGKQ